MTTQDRHTLKGYFGGGARPSAKHFEDLIDSALVMNDEGFIKTEQDGLKIITLAESQSLISFEGPKSTDPEWSLGFVDSNHNALTFRRFANRPVGQDPNATSAPPSALSLFDLPQGGPRRGYDAPPYVGVGTDQPTSKLDVRGVVSAVGRAGRRVDVPADGAPHTIFESEGTTGCVALEITAGVGIRKTGRFALVHATALNTYNPSRWDNWFGTSVWPIFSGKTPIRQTHAYYSRRADRLQLSWGVIRGATAHGLGARYTLQIRSRSAFPLQDEAGQPITDGDNKPKFANIRAFVTKLWFDPDMDWTLTGLETQPSGKTP